jgi:plasmid replication initiation protein
VSNTWTTYTNNSTNNVTYTSTGTWGTGSNTVWTTSTPSDIYCNDVVMQDGSRVSDLVKAIPYTVLPTGLDLSNPSIMDLVSRWYQSLEQLKLAHDQLMTMVALTQNNGNE